MALKERDLLEAMRVADIYRDAEQRILARVAETLTKGIDAPDWELKTLARVQSLRAEAIEELKIANEGVAAAYQAGISKQYESGNLAVLADLKDTIDPFEVASPTQRAAIERLQREMSTVLEDASQAILRTTTDSFRAVIAETTGAVVARGESRRSAAQRAVDKLFGKGESEFRDSAGRKWRIPEYVEMATRTGYARAQVQGHEDALDAAGLDLVVVQPGPRACDICDAWARAVLARSGESGTIKAFDYKTGGEIEVYVANTLDRARANGFQHPNCRCTIRAFIPGVTKPGDIDRPPWDENGYRAQQTQRSIERDIRDLKRKRAVALSPDRARELDAKVLAAQARMRAHMDANPELKRQSDREQISGRFGTPVERQTEAARRAGTTVFVSEEAAERIERAELEERARETATGLARYRVGDERTMREASDWKSSNPHRFLSGDYRNNCHNVVTAVELRRRGYEVIAAPTVNSAGRAINLIARDWVRADGTAPTFIELNDFGRTVASGIKGYAASIPDGARGFLAGAWKTGGGAHIFNWEKVDGELRFFEGQTDGDASEHPAKMKPSTMSFLRVDDLAPDERAQYTVQGPDEGGDAHLVEREIERAEALLERTTTELDEAQAAYRRAADAFDRHRMDSDAREADAVAWRTRQAELAGVSREARILLEALKRQKEAATSALRSARSRR